MSSTTIHSIEDELKRRLDEEARRRGSSKNRLIKDILARELGLPIEENRENEYAEFCGIWSEEERRSFEETQRENSRVDPREWESGWE